jgi:hypothetical protein
MQNLGKMPTLAETEGFEPSVGVIPLRRFSKPLVSATHPRLRLRQDRGYSEGIAIDQPNGCRQLTAKFHGLGVSFIARQAAS